MGFKRVSKEELASSKAPPFLGAPIQMSEKLDQFEAKETESEKIYEREHSNALLIAQELLKYEYAKSGLLSNFEGNGDIIVVNNSKKNRIWDVNLTYGGTDNISEHSMKEENKTNFGNFEPQTNKSLKYKIKNSEDIINPIKIFEKISVSNLNKENLGTKIKKRKIKKLEKEIEKRKENKKENIKEKYGRQIKGLESEVAKSNEELEQILEQISNLSESRAGFEKDIKVLKEAIRDLQKQKEKEKHELIDDYLNEEELENDLFKLLEETKKRLNSLNSKIPQIKKEYSNRKANIQKEIKSQYNQEIQQAEKEIEVKDKEYEKASKKEKEWSVKEEKIDNEISDLEDKLKNLEDKLKIKKIESKIEEKQKEHEKAEEKADLFSDKSKKLKKLIKNLRKDIKSYKKDRDKELDSKIDDLTDEKEDLIEEFEAKVEISQELRSHIEEIIEKYEDDLKTYDEKLEKKKKDFAVFKGELKDYIEKKEDFNKKIKDLKKKIQNLENLKEKEFKEEYKKIKKQKERRAQRILDGFDDMTGEKIRDNYYLLYNKENILTYLIKIENDSENTIEEVKLAKQFSEGFSNFKYDSSSVSNVKVDKNTLIFSIDTLDPGEKAEIMIYTSIKPVERKIIGTGNIHLSYKYKDRLISGLKFKNLNGYSHAMHAMKIKEKETTPNKWVCQMIFKNNSDINMKLNSIIVLDHEKKNKFLDVKFNSDNKGKLLKPQETYYSEKWEIKDKNKPSFYRKLNYSITHKAEMETLINLNLEESIFEIIDLSIDKKFTKSKIKSFEKSDLTCNITIKNIGTTYTKGLLIKETIPPDFLPPSDLSKIMVNTSSGKDFMEKIDIELLPEDQDPSKAHELNIRVNLENIKPLELINVNEFLKISYPFEAVKPDHKKEYTFPIEITSYYPKEKKSPEDFYYISRSLSAEELPDLKVIHQRRNLLIAKEIFPGRSVDEFAISLIANNSSNIEVKNIKIDDTLPKSIEVVSSNKDYKLIDSDLKNADTISFTIESILPFQEEEIRYYVKSKDETSLDQEKLESYLLT